MTNAITLMNPQERASVMTVVDLVRSKEATTRPEIGRITGLGRSVVTQRVQQAIDVGLLADFELGPSTGGRAPRHLRFVSERGCVLVGVFGALGVGVAVADLAGNILATQHREWDVAAGPAASLQHVSKLLEQLHAHGGMPEVWGVVVGVPGPVEFSTGRPIAPPIMPGWSGFDIRGWMEARFAAPVWVDNDANLMARGRLESLPKGTKADLLFVKVGTGIGAGLIAGGRLLRGANGAAGDVGHIIITEHPEVVCRCGQVGCLEAVAGGWALARDGLVEARSGRSAFLRARVNSDGVLRPLDVVNGALSGDPACVELVGKAGKVVGENVASMVSFFNPAVVAIGGVVATAGDLFLAAVRQAVYRRSLPLATRDLQIIAATDPDEGLRGGAALAIDEIFDRESFLAWLPEGRPALHLHQTEIYGAAV